MAGRQSSEISQLRLGQVIGWHELRKVTCLDSLQEVRPVDRGPQTFHESRNNNSSWDLPTLAASKLLKESV